MEIPMTRQSTKQQTIQPERGVTRIYRVASKIGEDFHTVEMTVTLPVGATDAEIAEAIDLGTRIYGCLPLGVKARTVYGRDETPRFSGFSPK
jgi:hypothetical protein